MLWNAHAGELWRRTRIAVDRALAPLASAVLGCRVTVAGARDLLKVSYVKVAEFQKRGLVHLHVVLRLDGVDAGDRSAVVAPPAWASAGLLAEAVEQAVDAVSFALPSPDGVLRAAHWGARRDITDVSASGRGCAPAARWPPSRASARCGSYRSSEARTRSGARVS
ncbi:hypothetical protein HDA32_003048 [Spinactinospora alkalitolerans]|uniref:Replication initiation protein n=1 Tax=Spinactinospora alkalitolerans TaxID=687207 RepID=A0A852TVG2_9ACTN|nr:replication initiator [Spinactinospora alkalitolerans]NYE47928.1 hypothetical protein [Spinactinospora alkalitolerans]